MSRSAPLLRHNHCLEDAHVGDQTHSPVADRNIHRRRVFLDSLRFKFTGHPTPEHIFTTLREWSGIGLFYPAGPWIIGLAELAASLLLLAAPVILFILPFRPAPYRQRQRRGSYGRMAAGRQRGAPATQLTFVRGTAPFVIEAEIENAPAFGKPAKGGFSGLEASVKSGARKAGAGQTRAGGLGVQIAPVSMPGAAATGQTAGQMILRGGSKFPVKH